MRYPIAIEPSSDATAFGVVIPDLPGCFSAGDTLDEAIAGAKDAAEAWVDVALDAGEAIPTPSSLDALGRNPDYSGWKFGVITIDFAVLDGPSKPGNNLHAAQSWNDTPTTAVDMANAQGIDPKRFRAELRNADLGWHSHNGRWEVVVGSSEHRDMERVMASLTGKQLLGPRNVSGSRAPSRTASSDETYIIDLCDEVLGLTARRQHCFTFLVGDPGPNGTRKALPVDAFYPALNLVVEYHERQHTERVGFFDDKITVSGVPRGEQRRRYDEFRQQLLPQNGYLLAIFDYNDFGHDRSKRLLRNPEDKLIVSQRLKSIVAK